MRTLIIAPHLDDETISCAGLILNRCMLGGDVFVVTVHNRVYNYGTTHDNANQTQHFEEAKLLLGYGRSKHFMNLEGEPFQHGFYWLLAQLEDVLSAFEPTEVVIPAYDDLNQDHRHLNHIMSIALRPVNLKSVTRVLEFIALDGVPRAPNYFVTMTEEAVTTKLAALRAYTTEGRETGPRSPDNIIAQAKVWGAMSGTTYAEGYRVKLWRE